ncbi:MAG: type II toxin-antitoxin system VapC family toxin [Bryobacteraceae bacterium]
MKAFLDTSVLISIFYPDHEHHQRSMDVLLRHSKGEVCCAAHSLAEVYAGLTAMPGKKRVSGDEAVLFLQNIRERMTLISLIDTEYFYVAEAAALLGLTSGAIYDLILGQCAEKAGARTIYTWNLKHFLRLGPAIASRVKTP